MSFDSALPVLSLAGSVFSTAATAYFWLVQARRERPNLRAYLAEREFYLGDQSSERRQIGVKLGVLVANYSTLPNSLLGVRAWLRLRDGDWLPLENLTFDRQTPLPFNLPPMQTVILRVNAYAGFALTSSLEASKPLTGYLGHYVAEPREFKIELRALNDRTDTHVLAPPAVAA